MGEGSAYRVSFSIGRDGIVPCREKRMEKDRAGPIFATIGHRSIGAIWNQFWVIF